ncbi:hypothetical protein [Streptomyces sp. YU58]|uniref:hypothetical protein n=1 Tax=Streptomyces sp. SX92 TaxID=3158972 RepID=UPI0027BA5BB5|nr:hypothetical protein [Streptomyces coralus]WLW53235.1 hypothetical protein QU709_18425 [Streptomyces coralus]
MSNVHPIGAAEPEALFWVMSVDKPGVASASQCGTYILRPGATRQDAYLEIYEEVTAAHPPLRGGTVVFFSLESNRL